MSTSVNARVNFRLIFSYISKLVYLLGIYSVLFSVQTQSKPMFGLRASDKHIFMGYLYSKLILGRISSDIHLVAISEFPNQLTRN